MADEVLSGLGRFYYPETIQKLYGNLGWRAWAGKGGLGWSGLARLGLASLGWIFDENGVVQQKTHFI